MEKTPHDKLEELIQRELSKLPEREAPSSLVPRVLARIEARERAHWWQRPWTQWPIVLQSVSVPLLLASAVGAVFGASAAWDFILAKASVAVVPETAGALTDTWDVLAVLGNALLILSRSVGQAWLMVALLTPLFLYFTCVGLGTLCYRTAFYRR